MIISIIMTIAIGVVIGLIIGLTLGSYYGARAENRRVTNLFKKRFPYLDIVIKPDSALRTTQRETIKPTLILELDKLRTSKRQKNKLH